ncbi:Cu(I)-responsive transcriptional regulator [Neorhizobium galegae bv. officinalis bv. officinalis str. HAMBI 1141]|uniref:Cu(I)-responsive transcriptional regulator n=1 Tax=Neorhizobium galegae bv. officinalis bv. officinalis str. HAMBI 1141 TaxID=1028801 RepID=A0A068TDM4_NEOGA|nr:helix-turn-helix domain-containing protein [Neorhizobium galegae]CDN56518.1 Cu(I)-responsive transcriptional regulator [Neorhizobium galegae bv. officinalis bv. officinalis str. HAMBI 1141]
MNTHPRGLTIGALASASGVSTPTIRYYEEIGLLPSAHRTASGQRVYDQSDIARITFMKRCRDFGFSIEQVRVLAGLSVSSDKDCTEVRDIARAHLQDLRERLEELRALERSMSNFVEACDTVCAGGVGVDCVIFKDLSDPNNTCC